MGLGDFLQDALEGVSDAAHWVGENVHKVVVPFADDEDEKPKPLEPGEASLGGGLEKAAWAWNWVYSNALSQPLSTFNLMAAQENSKLFSATEWNQAWHAAEHISATQAFALNLTWDSDAAARAAERAIDSPLNYYEPPEGQLPANWRDIPFEEQQRILKESGMPVDPRQPNRYIGMRQDESDLFKYGTGVGDFALRIFADPLIIAGKGAAVLRAKTVTRARPAEGWSASEIDKIINKSVVTRARQYIFANRDNPQLLNNLDLARKSAMGPRFGAIASTLKTEGEVADFLRVGMGDVGAMRRLEAQNKLAAHRIRMDSARLPALGLRHTAHLAANNPRAAALVKAEIDRLNAAVNADTALVSRYETILAHADELDQLNLTRWGFARAEQRTQAQNVYQAGAARKGQTRYRPIAHLPEPLVARRTAAQDAAATAAEQRALAAGKSQGQANKAAIEARRAAVPFGDGLVKTRIWGLGDFYSTPITMIRSLREKHPNGWMRLDDIDDYAIAEVRGHLARIPNLRPETRQGLLNDYLKTATEAERRDLMYKIDHLGMVRVSEKHGLTAKEGTQLFEEYMKRKFGEIDKMKRYSAAMKTDPARGQKVRVDEFTVEGGKVVLEPFTVSRLINSHVFSSLDDLDKVLARHSSAIKALRASRGGNPDWIMDAADWFSGFWKFTTLFRLGYIPRVLGDDLAGQWAWAGSAAMAARVGWGVKNGATNLAHRSLPRFGQAKEKTALEGVKYADDELKLLMPQMRQLQGKVAGLEASAKRDLARAQRRRDSAANQLAAYAGGATPKRAALEKLVKQRERDLLAAQRRVTIGDPGKMVRLRDMQARQGFLERSKKDSLKAAQEAQEYQVKRMQGMRPVTIGGQTYSAAFAGREGEYAMRLISADDSVAQIMNTNKELIHGNLQRSFNHGGKVVSVAQDEAEHLKGWSHALNNQMGQDSLSRLALQGASVDDMTQWLTRTPQGRVYRKRLPKMVSAEQVSQAVWHEVAEYAPDPLIRAAALKGEATVDFLKTAVPNKNLRPYEVHIGQVGHSQLAYESNLGRVKEFWFKWAATIPANRMSRHPLYNQLYEGHIKTIHRQRVKQGATPATVAEVEAVETAARRLALRDTRKLVFDIAHRSDAAAATRFMSPFFSATSESFQRWGRIIADKPQTVGYAANFFNAPAAMGSLQDMDGNTIHPDGYTYTRDPKTGKTVKRLVPKAERYIIARMPKWFVESPLGVVFGVERASGNMALSQNSMNIVTQGDPWFNPGVGPIVSIPVNEIVKDKPSEAELARHLGILPFGPQGGTLFGDNPAGRAMTMFSPATVKNFVTAFDTSDERYQRVKMHIMQKALWEHENQGKPMPSAQKIADMTRNYWLFSAGSAFLQPMATQRKDAYQFYRDQYNTLRRANAQTADQEFLERFGESYFVFAQSETKSVGIPSTKKAVKLSQEFADLIAASPELAPLIVGPDGDGPFSREAYAYQLNTPLIPGDSEMQRSKMSAEEAMKENKRREGWAKFTAAMNRITAKLHAAGFKSFSDPGAEEFAQEKKNWTAVYAEPLYPDGTVNPYFNKEWAEDFNTFEPKKYDTLIPELTKLARSRLADIPHRSDLRVLQEYLGGRQWLMGELSRRYAEGGRKTLGARANADLKAQWTAFVDDLVERDTRFGDLHHRYLSRDMGVDIEEEAEEV